MLAPEMAHSTPSEQAQMTATMRDKRGEAGGQVVPGKTLVITFYTNLEI